MNVSKLIQLQLKNILMFHIKLDELEDLVQEALQCFELNVEGINSKYYRDNTQTYNHLNSDHNCLFIYYLSRMSLLAGKVDLADALFLLNKTFCGVDLYHSVVFGKYVLFVHPVGTVVGKARFSGSIVIYQNVTIGATHQNIYPHFKGSCILYSGVSVIGDCDIGDNVIFGAGSAIINMSIPDNSMVIGRYNDVKILPLPNRDLGKSLIVNF